MAMTRSTWSLQTPGVTAAGGEPINRGARTLLAPWLLRTTSTTLSSPGQVPRALQCCVMRGRLLGLGSATALGNLLPLLHVQKISLPPSFLALSTFVPTRPGWGTPLSIWRLGTSRMVARATVVPCSIHHRSCRSC